MKQSLRKTLSLLLAVCLAASLALPAAAANDLSYSVMITPQYEDADSFSNDCAAVKQNGKWGYIDKTGKQIIACKYDVAMPFSEGLALVGTAGNVQTYVYGSSGQSYQDTDGYLWSVIDKSGKETPLMFNDYYTGTAKSLQAGITKVAYDDIYYPQVLYYGGYIVLTNYVSANSCGTLVFDRSGKQHELGSLSDGYGVATNYCEGLFGAYYLGGGADVFFLTKDGTQAVTVYGNYENAEYHNLRAFNQGLAPVSTSNISEGYDLWGFVNTSGSWVIQPQYLDFMVLSLYGSYQVFSDGLAAVKNTSEKWGCIDKTGATVIPFIYDAMYGFSEGLSCAEKNGKWGVIDTKNNTVVDFSYDQLSTYSGGLCAAVKNGSAFCIDRSGNKIAGSDAIAQETYFVGGDSNIVTTFEDIIVIKENGKYGYAKIGYTPAAPAKSDMDSWAYDEVVKAIDTGLVPADLQNQYPVNIDRADFAALAVKLVEVATGKDIDDVILAKTGKTLDELEAQYPFSDTNDTDVIAAAALGIVNGNGNGTFAPYNSISRQEAAAMLMRVGKYLGKTDDSAASGFADESSISSWAKQAVAYVRSVGVMNGTSPTQFSPYETYTRQQAYMTILRLYQAVKGA